MNGLDIKWLASSLSKLHFELLAELRQIMYDLSHQYNYTRLIYFPGQSDHIIKLFLCVKFVIKVNAKVYFLI